MAGGAVADAKDRRRVLLATQVMLGLTSVGLALNASLAHPSLWPIFLCTAASACFQGFDWPARNAALPMLVPMDEVPAALALQSILWQTSAVVGPALAGLLISQFGINVVFMIDVATFGVALLAVASLPALLPAGPKNPVSLGAIAEGFRHLAEGQAAAVDLLGRSQRHDLRHAPGRLPRHRDRSLRRWRGHRRVAVRRPRVSAPLPPRW